MSWGRDWRSVDACLLNELARQAVEGQPVEDGQERHGVVKGGFFPWQAKSSVSYRDLQPQLWLLPAMHPQGVWTQDL
jgi:hypothetical protein